MWVVSSARNHFHTIRGQQIPNTLCYMWTCIIVIQLPLTITVIWSLMRDMTLMYQSPLTVYNLAQCLYTRPSRPRNVIIMHFIFDFTACGFSGQEELCRTHLLVCCLPIHIDCLQSDIVCVYQAFPSGECDNHAFHF